MAHPSWFKVALLFGWMVYLTPHYDKMIEEQANDQQ